MTETPPEDQQHESQTPMPPMGEESHTSTPQIQVPVQQVRVQLPQSRPIVTYTLISITILVYLAQVGSQFLFGGDVVAAMGMKVNDYILQGEIWRFITPIFLHGSVLHIGFNMYALYALGPELERFYGHTRFTVLYFVSGFTGVVGSFIFTQNPSLGASTAVFGLIGAYGVFLYQNQKLFGARAQAALRNILSIAAINLIIGLQPGIDNWGHVGGLVGGGLLAWLAGPFYKLAGESPDLHLEDQRNEQFFLAAALGVFVLFALLVWAKIVLF